MRYTVYRYTPQYGNLHRQKWWLTSGSMGPYFGQTFSVNHPFFGETVWLIAFWKSHHFLNFMVGKTWKDIWCNQEATGQGQIWRRNINPIAWFSASNSITRKPPNLGGSLLAVFIRFHPRFFSQGCLVMSSQFPTHWLVHHITNLVKNEISSDVSSQRSVSCLDQLRSLEDINYIRNQ